MRFTRKLIPVLGASLVFMLQACGGSDSDPLAAHHQLRPGPGQQRRASGT